MDAVDGHFLSHKMTVTEWICYLQNVCHVLCGNLFWFHQPVLADEVLDDTADILCRATVCRLCRDFAYPRCFLQVFRQVIQFKADVIGIDLLSSHGITKSIELVTEPGKACPGLYILDSPVGSLFPQFVNVITFHKVQF